MRIEAALTQADIARARSVPNTALILADARLGALQVMNSYATRYIMPIVATAIGKSPREILLSALYTRALAYGQTASELRSAIHFQSLLAASRSVLELCIDMELIHKTLVPDAVPKVYAHVNGQKLRAARRLVEFSSKYPSLKAANTVVDQIRYIATDGTAIEAGWKAYWPQFPQHWSALGLPQRSELCGDDTKVLLSNVYDMQNFAVHSSVTGVLGFKPEHHTGMAALGIEVIGKCLVAGTKIISPEMKIDCVLVDFEQDMKLLDDVIALTFIDAKLRTLGDAPHVVVHT